MRKTPLALGICSLFMLASCVKDVKESNQLVIDETASATPSDNPLPQATSDPYVANEVLVKFKKGSNNNGKAKALGLVKGTVKEKILTKTMEKFGDEGFVLVQTTDEVLEAVGKLKKSEDVEYAEPNYIYQHDATANDTYYTNGGLWGMYGDATIPSNQFGSQAGEAWEAGHTGAKTVVVGIIDEGIQFTHPDLTANVWTNPFDPADGKDNDGNGYIDDIHGWDFAGNNNSVYDGGKRGSSDDHGTHVAGTIGATGNNKSGVVGVNWTVTMISCKFLGQTGGSLANAIRAIDYVTDLKTRHGLNIPATNNSWGGGAYSQSLKDAIERANAKNILFVAAAGNDGQNTEAVNSTRYPSGYDNANIIAVAAIDKFGAIASFSNYAATKVDLGAPGVATMSTTAFNTYSSYSGTSMATPHVTGGVALYASTHPNLSAADIKAAILNSAVPTPSLTGKCVTGGRLNVSGF